MEIHSLWIGPFILFVMEHSLKENVLWMNADSLIILNLQRSIFITLTGLVPEFLCLLGNNGSSPLGPGAPQGG